MLKNSWLIAFSNSKTSTVIIRFCYNPTSYAPLIDGCFYNGHSPCQKKSIDKPAKDKNDVDAKDLDATTCFPVIFQIIRGLNEHSRSKYFENTYSFSPIFLLALIKQAETLVEKQEAEISRGA